jgi:hypothetical protein
LAEALCIEAGKPIEDSVGECKGQGQIMFTACSNEDGLI